jgi:hypothetical protein
MWAELRWHPEQGSTINFVNLGSDASTRRRELAELDRVVKLTMYRMARGRPLHSGSRGGFSDEDFLAQLEAVTISCWRQGRPTIADLLRVLRYPMSERALNRFTQEQCGMTVKIFIEKYRPR